MADLIARGLRLRELAAQPLQLSVEPVSLGFQFPDSPLQAGDVIPRWGRGQRLAQTLELTAQLVGLLSCLGLDLPKLLAELVPFLGRQLVLRLEALLFCLEVAHLLGCLGQLCLQVVHPLRVR